MRPLAPLSPAAIAARRRQRGAAEIETMGVIMFILIPMFLIVGGLSILTPARLANVFTVQADAYQSATTPDLTPDAVASDADTGVMLDDVTGDIHDLDAANHLYTVESQKTVKSPSVTYLLPTITLTDEAQLIGGPWAFSSYPIADDSTALEKWSMDSAVETNDEVIANSLELRKGWPADGSGD